MLTEEAHHMFVGESGVGRIIQRTCEAMNQAGVTDAHDIGRVRDLGVIDLPTIQKKANLHYSLTLDLFGSEISTNAANAFNAGIKGRFQETRIDDDHKLHDATYPVLEYRDSGFVTIDEPALTALNARLRDDYSEDCRKGVQRWNKVIEKTGVAFELALPHVAFHRKVGQFSGANVTPQGEVIAAEAWQARQGGWLPSDADMEYIHSLMKPVLGTGAFAPWIAGPKVGIDNKPGDFEYVKLA
jgi:benzoyl-CoA 2,3-dioxygenase component B